MSFHARGKMLKRLGLTVEKLPKPRYMDETMRLARLWHDVYGIDPDAERHWRELDKVVSGGKPEQE